MFQTKVSETKVFPKFDEARSYIDKRDYQTVKFEAKNATITPDRFMLKNGESFVMTDVFVDAIFANTRLPRKNETVLPIENVVKDINTLLSNDTNEYDMLLLNGDAYSLFRGGAKGTRMPLTHKQFLDTIQHNTDIDDVKSISLTPYFLRVTTYDDKMSHEVLEGDFHHFGVDYSNGEVFRSKPLTAGLMLYRTSCSNSAVAPFDEKYVKIRACCDQQELQQKFAEVCTSLVIDYDKIKTRIQNLDKTKMNAAVLKFIAGSLGFVPQTTKEKLFGEYFETDDDGKMTKILKPSIVENTSLYSIYNEITRLAHHETDVDESTRFKMEYFAGSLLDENNRKMKDLIQA
jgi:hypothetical protein